MYLAQSSQLRFRPLKPTVAMFRVESPVNKMVEVAVVASVELLDGITGAVVLSRRGLTFSNQYRVDQNFASFESREIQVIESLADDFADEITYWRGANQYTAVGWISDLDLAFLDFWEAKDGQHGAVCSERPIYGDCAECDALSLLRTNREGVSEELHRHLLSIGQFDPFGKMTLPIALMRPSMAV